MHSGHFLDMYPLGFRGSFEEDGVFMPTVSHPFWASGVPGDWGQAVKLPERHLFEVCDPTSKMAVILYYRLLPICI